MTPKTDPFSAIPNSDDREHSGTELETPGERKRREDKENER